MLNRRNVLDCLTIPNMHKPDTTDETEIIIIYVPKGTERETLVGSIIPLSTMSVYLFLSASNP